MIMLSIDTQSFGFLYWYCGCLVCASPFMFIAASRAVRRRSEVAIEMSGSMNLESIGVLVDTLTDGDGWYDRRCREALIWLLPFVNDDNSHLLDEYRQATLRYTVRPSASPIFATYLTRLSRNSAQGVALRISIVEALSRVGDSESLTMFDELLECRAYSVNERRIQQVVRENRAALSSRVASLPAKRSLLRPVNRFDARTLVRIPSNGFELAPEELLHVKE